MKIKKSTAFLTALCLISAGGCTVEDISYSSEPDSGTTTISGTTTEVVTTTEVTTTTEATTTTSDITTEATTTTAPVEDIAAIGQTMYENACERIFLMFCSNYYTTSDDMIMDEDEWMAFYPVTDSRVKTVEDVKADFRTLFTEDFSASYMTDIDQKFRMIDGALYAALSERGSDITYESTELTLKSNYNGVAIFDAVSHYTDLETNEALPDQSCEFILVKEDDVWRVDKFTLPF